MRRGWAVDLTSPASGVLRVADGLVFEAIGKAVAEGPQPRTDEGRGLAEKGTHEGAGPGAVRDAAAPGPVTRVQREFAEWIETRDGKLLAIEVVRRARALRAEGKRRGIAALFESIRYDSDVGLLGPGAYVLNNDMRAPLARWIMERAPDLAGFFDLRERKG